MALFHEMYALESDIVRFTWEDYVTVFDGLAFMLDPDNVTYHAVRHDNVIVMVNQ